MFVQIRRIHFLAGLFLLVELWIFMFSGLMLNHPQWEISQFWGKRAVTDREVPLPALQGVTEEERALELMRKLGITGELESITWSQNPDSFRIGVSRPSEVTSLVVRPDLNKVEISKSSTNVFGLLSMLHTFNGVDFENGGRTRNWPLTSLWTSAMDLLCAALIFWALSGIYLWLSARRERLVGTVTLFAGFVLVLLFVTVPAWL